MLNGRIQDLRADIKANDKRQKVIPVSLADLETAATGSSVTFTDHLSEDGE